MAPSTSFTRYRTYSCIVPLCCSIIIIYQVQDIHLYVTPILLHHHHLPGTGHTLVLYPYIAPSSSFTRYRTHTCIVPLYCSIIIIYQVQDTHLYCTPILLHHHHLSGTGHTLVLYPYIAPSSSFTRYRTYTCNVPLYCETLRNEI